MQDPSRPLLVLDAGSPLSSVAVAHEGRLLASRALDRRSEEGDLLAAIAGELASAGVARGDLAGVVALRGPGSFTGLRIGGSIALGLGRGLDRPVGSVSTFDALALAAPAGRVLAAVDAMRGEWHVRTLERDAPDWPTPLGEPSLVAAGSVPGTGVEIVIGFGVEAVWRSDGDAWRAVEAPALAAPVAERLSAGSGPAWWLEPVTRPHYLRAPAVRLPSGPK